MIRTLTGVDETYGVWYTLRSCGRITSKKVHFTKKREIRLFRIILCKLEVFFLFTPSFLHAEYPMRILRWSENKNVRSRFSRFYFLRARSLPTRASSGSATSIFQCVVCVWAFLLPF